MVAAKADRSAGDPVGAEVRAGHEAAVGVRRGVFVELDSDSGEMRGALGSRVDLAGERRPREVDAGSPLVDEQGADEIAPLEPPGGAAHDEVVPGADPPREIEPQARRPRP
jgi:hypothetical protein